MSGRSPSTEWHEDHGTLLTRLRDIGLRITAQRRAVAEALDGANAHRSAEDVLARAKAILPEVSRATVYSALAEFVELGLVGEVQHGRAKLYDPNAHIEHHHLVCDRCGRVWDVHVAPPLPAMVPVADQPSVTVKRVQIQFVGRCADCERPSPGDG